jgi:hypothetical protein
MNHDDARLAIDMMDDAEVGRWFRGWLAGAGGNAYADDKVDAWPPEMRTGYASGRDSHADAEAYSEKQRERVNKRYHGTTTVAPRNYHSNATGSLPTNNQQPTTNNEQETTNNENPPLPPKGGRSARAVAPTEPEWVAYCSETWPDWHPECAAESWAYYKSKGWKIGTVPCRDWKAVARTAHGNARNWGKLQPIAARGTNLAGSGGRTGQMSSEDQNRLKGLQIQKAAAERNLRIARNYPAEHDVDDCRRKLDAIRAQILRMGVDPDATTEAAR